MEYAVLDIETTGLYPGGHDRIIEVAVVRLTSELQPTSEYCTLINPQRDLGPSWLHGIRAADLVDAPLFEEIAGAISNSLGSALIVGHNIRFDLRFLQAEFSRAGYEIATPPHIDTMSIAVQAGAGSRRLEEACDLFGIESPPDHSALRDARATASLFTRCVEHFGLEQISTWTRKAFPHSATAWPSLDVFRKPFPRKASAEKSLPSQRFLAELVAELPAHSSNPGEWQAYYAVLDRALEDRRISAEEQGALRQTAQSEGLSRDDVVKANAAYLKSLVLTAVADGIVSDPEQEDLRQVSHLLGLESELESYIEDARNHATRIREPTVKTAEVPLEGKTVCFTGALCGIINGERATREMASKIAALNGMRVVKSVTKKLDYLVIADPDSMSGKAKKARKYGTRILAEPVFWSLTGIQPE